jgi:hypothetical protein
MTKPQIYNIDSVTLKSIKDFILDNNLEETQSVLLNQVDYDNLALEHRQIYHEAMAIPFFLLRILIDEDDTRSVRRGMIGVISDGRITFDENELAKEYPYQSHAYDTLYRCARCGDMVDIDGKALDEKTRQFRIDLFEKYRRTVREIKVDGNCCRR